MASRKDPIVLSYGDSLLRTSDLKLLDRGNWLNDNLISFWFAYLTDTFTPKNGDQLFGWLSPEIAQLIKSAQYSKEMHHELKTILESGGYLQKSVLFIPLNDCDFTDCGGRHLLSTDAINLIGFHLTRFTNQRFIFDYHKPGNHWSLLVYRCGESERCKFEHYDSSNGSNIETASKSNASSNFRFL